VNNFSDEAHFSIHLLSESSIHIPGIFIHILSESFIHMPRNPQNQDKTATLTFTRIPLPAQYPLLTRGFHFINEWGVER
jgi:hypothetical protein